jgi:hypothetical protein
VKKKKKKKLVRERENKIEIIGRSLFFRPYYFVDNLLLIKLFFNGLLFRKKKFLFYKLSITFTKYM